MVSNDNDSILIPVATEIRAKRLTNEQRQYIKEIASVIRQNVTPVDEYQEEDEICIDCMGSSLYINGINYYRDLGLPNESYIKELNQLIKYLNEISPIPIIFSSIAW